MLPRTTIYFLFFFIFSSMTFLKEVGAQIGTSANRKSTPLEIYYYSEPEAELIDYEGSAMNAQSQSLTEKEVFEAFRQGKFRKSDTRYGNPDLGYNERAWWLAIPVENNSDRSMHFELSVLNPDLQRISFLQFNDSAKVLKESVSGKEYPFKRRELKHRFYIFPYKLAAHSKNTLMLRIHHPYMPFYAPLQISAYGTKAETDAPYQFFYMAFAGMMFFVMLIGFFLFIIIRKRLYLFYALYILFSTLYFFAEEGMDFQWLYPNWQGVVSFLPVLYGCLSLFFVIQFAAHFLELKEKSPSLQRLVKQWQIVFGLLLFICGSLLFSELILQHKSISSGWAFKLFSLSIKGFVLSGWILQVFMVVYMAWHKNRNAYYYLLAISSLIFTTTYNIFCGLGWIHKMYLPVNPMIVGFMFEIFVLTFALIYWFNETERERTQLVIDLKHQQLEAAEKQLAIQEAERTRIAKDLHDELGSNLASLKLQIESMPDTVMLSKEMKTYILGIIGDSSTRLSDITHNLMPPAFFSTPFPNVLDNYFEHLKHNAKIYFEFNIINYRPVFSKEMELILYRIALELSHNIIKHSNASAASIQLIYDEHQLTLQAEDNGIGFEVRQSGIGLESIQARVNYLQGRMTIDSGQRGTLINIELPYERKQDG